MEKKHRRIINFFETPSSEDLITIKGDLLIGFAFRKVFLCWIASFQALITAGKDGPHSTIVMWYILPSGGLYATYHLLGEPETTID